MSETLRDRIKKERKRLGWDQAALAERAHTNRTQISRWEGGDGEKFLERIGQLAAVLGVRPGYLAFGEGDSPGVVAVARRALRDIMELARVRGLEVDSMAAPTTGDASTEAPAGPQEAPAAGDATVATAETRIIRPTDDDEVLPDVRFEPRRFTADELTPLHRGKVAEIAGLAAGKARYFELVESGHYHENGVRYIIAEVNGRSMETKIPNRSRVVLEAFPRPLEFRSGDSAEGTEVRDGHVYMVALDDALVTLKRLYLTDFATTLGAYNRREFGKNGLETIKPGEPFRVLAKWAGFYEG